MFSKWSCPFELYIKCVIGNPATPFLQIYKYMNVDDLGVSNILDKRYESINIIDLG